MIDSIKCLFKVYKIMREIEGGAREGEGEEEREREGERARERGIERGREREGDSDYTI